LWESCAAGLGREKHDLIVTPGDLKYVSRQYEETESAREVNLEKDQRIDPHWRCSSVGGEEMSTTYIIMEPNSESG
jgi:hypothetical protein